MGIGKRKMKHNFSDILKQKVIAILKQLPNIIKIDPKCYSYQDRLAFFIWSEYEKQIVPFMLEINKEQDLYQKGHDTSYQFAVRQLYCRYDSREYFLADLLGKTPQEVDRYFDSGYSIENNTNIYVIPETYRDNYLIDTEFVLGEFLHYLDTWPLDPVTHTRQVITIMGPNVEQISDLTLSEIANIKQQTIKKQFITNYNQANAKDFFLGALTNSFKQLPAKPAISILNLNLNDIYEQFFHGDYARQVIACYEQGQPAVICQLDFKGIIQIETSNRQGKLLHSLSWQLSGSILELMKDLTLMAEDSGIVVIN